MDGASRGRVVAHADLVHLREVRFSVSAAGRRRVLRERVKNVHAGVLGQLVDALHTGAARDASWGVLLESFERGASAVSYNPYLNESFVLKSEGAPIHEAAECLLRDRVALVRA